jgi:hypothetical protein
MTPKTNPASKGSIKKSMQDIRIPRVIERQRNRAEEMMFEISNRYRFTKNQVKGKNRSLDLLCFAGGMPVRVNRLSSFKDHCIIIEGTTEDGATLITYAPVEQVTFQIVVTNKPSEQPAREIGFHTSKGEAKE